MLAEWTRIRGRVAWYVYAGPCRDLGEKGWQVFWSKLAAANLKPKARRATCTSATQTSIRRIAKRGCSRSSGRPSSSCGENLKEPRGLGRGAGLVV